MSTVGERIKQRRQALGYTQDRLATQAGISKGFLSDVETGTRNPSAEYLLRIGDALNVSLDYLMKGGALPSLEPLDRSVSIPASLAQFAIKRDLPFGVVKAILEAKLQFVANRRDTVDDDLEKFDWAGFYEAINEYL
jgi:transcriptional regulator with XRE-family HTH domain